MGWGPQEDEESIAAIHRALELGVNWIDTAAAYGFGHSEEVVGRAIAGLDERPYVFTKGGSPRARAARRVHDLKRDSLRRELEGSLARLGVDAIDLYQIHWPIPDEEIEEGWSALVELKERRASCATSASRTSASSSCAASRRSRPSRRCSRRTR